MGANSFLNEMTPIYMGGNIENDRVVSIESIPIHLTSRHFFYDGIQNVFLRYLVVKACTMS